MTIVYLKHPTLFQDPFMKSQCFVRSKFRPWSFGDTKTRKLIFIPKKAMTIKFQSILHKATEFHLIWPTFLWIMLCWKFCVENRSNFRTVRNIWRKFLLRVLQPHQNLSQFQVCPKYQILYMLLFCPEFLIWKQKIENHVSYCFKSNLWETPRGFYNF